MPKPKSRVSRVLVSGPLAPYTAAFAAKLESTGYTPLSAVTQLRLLAHVSRWLDANRLGARDLTDARVEEFFEARRAAGCTWLVTRRALTLLLRLLADLGALPPSDAPAERSAVDVLLARFYRYLLDERGLASSTASAYLGRARRFVAGYAPGAQLDVVTARDVTGAVLAESTAVSAGSAQYFVAALRAFLRFCRIEGLVIADLSAAALAVTRRRRSLPTG